MKQPKGKGSARSRIDQGKANGRMTYGEVNETIPAAVISGDQVDDVMTMLDDADIEIVDDCWSTPLDPRMPPEKRDAGIHTNSRAIFYAVRPYQWKDRFPMVNRADRKDIRKVMDKFRGILPFPKE